MWRKYEVYIDGRRLLIAGSDDVEGIEGRVRKVVVGTHGSIVAAIEAWRAAEEVQDLVLHGPDPEALWERFRSGYRSVSAAGGCVTDERRRLLAIHRLGVWDLPKGKVDPGETTEGAALREVREECGISHIELVRRLCETWHTYERGGRSHLKRTDWYLMRGSSADRLVPQLTEDITEVRWLDEAGVAMMKDRTYPSLLNVISAWERAVLDRA